MIVSNDSGEVQMEDLQDEADGDAVKVVEEAVGVDMREAGDGIVAVVVFVDSGLFEEPARDALLFVLVVDTLLEFFLDRFLLGVLDLLLLL